MNRRNKLFAAFVALAFLLGACGQEDQPDAADEPSGAAEFNQPFTDVEAYPVFVSSEIVVGPNRFLVGLLNDEDAPIGSPEIDMHIAFYDLEESTDEPVFDADLDFVWIQEEVNGLYVGQVEFPSAGRWGAEVILEGPELEETVKASFDVREEPMTPAIGAPAPRTDTPTLDDVKKLSEITTDDDPTRRFYETSVKEALKSGEPFVLIFATPEFCASAACGPMLDVVEGVATDFPDLTFIHVEPYDLDKVPELVPVPAVTKWGLPSEPWVFVVNADGEVVAKYEGLVGPEELTEQLEEP